MSPPAWWTRSFGGVFGIDWNDFVMKRVSVGGVFSYLKYNLSISTHLGLTVLITTKYPEEIGFAYKVGLMRNGHIYVEDRPEELRHRYACTTYDELYSRFCESNIPRRIRDSIAPYLGAADGGAGGGCGDGSSSGGKDHLSNSGSMMFPIFDRLGGIDSSRYPTPPRVNRWPLPMAEWPICERRRTAYLSQ